MFLAPPKEGLPGVPEVASLKPRKAVHVFVDAPRGALVRFRDGGLKCRRLESKLEKALLLPMGRAGTLVALATPHVGGSLFIGAGGHY